MKTRIIAHQLLAALVKREVPDARLRLVGRYSDGSLKPSGDEIVGLGWVEDSAQEIATVGRHSPPASARRPKNVSD